MEAWQIACFGLALIIIGLIGHLKQPRFSNRTDEFYWLSAFGVIIVFGAFFIIGAYLVFMYS